MPLDGVVTPTICCDPITSYALHGLCANQYQICRVKEVINVNEKMISVHFNGVQVTECRLVVDPRTRESRGFGFVTMDSAEDADRCIKYLNRSTLEGRIITVEKVSLESHLVSCTTHHCSLE